MALTEEEKKKEDNRLKILFALAILLGGLEEKDIRQTNEWSDIPKDIQEKVLIEYAKDKERFEKLVDQPKLEQPEIQKEMVEVSKSSGGKIWRIENPGDGKTCEKCRAWIGRLVSDTVSGYPSTQDWINSGALHPRCRCSLHEVSEIVEVDQQADDYLHRKWKRLLEKEEFERSFNVASGDDLVFL